MTNKEKVEVLLKYFGTELGNVNLSDIDFGDRTVYNNGQRAKEIYNTSQEAKEISNNYQKAEVIFNCYQAANRIYNDDQVIKPNYETMSKEELIARIKELENDK